MNEDQIVFVDTETISLNRDWRHLWEISLLVPATPEQPEHTFTCYPTVPLAEADPKALQIGRFHDRHPRQGVNVSPEDRKDKAWMTEGYIPRQRESWAAQIVRLTANRHLVGAVPSFDEQRLWDFCKAHGQTPMWHYHLIDVEALAAGFIAGRSLSLSPRPPWNSNDLSRAVGVEPDDFDRHTALGDCHWAHAIYQAVVRD